MNQHRVDEVQGWVFEGQSPIGDGPCWIDKIRDRDGRTIAEVRFTERSLGHAAGYAAAAALFFENVSDLTALREAIEALKATTSAAAAEPLLEWEAYRVGTWAAPSRGGRPGRLGSAPDWYRITMATRPGTVGCMFSIDDTDRQLGIYHAGDAVQYFRTLDEAMDACEAHERGLIAAEAGKDGRDG